MLNKFNIKNSEGVIYKSAGILQKLESLTQYLRKRDFANVINNNNLKGLIVWGLKIILLYRFASNNEFINLVGKLSRLAQQRGSNFLSVNYLKIVKNFDAYYQKQKPLMTGIKDGLQNYYQSLHKQKKEFIIQSREKIFQIQKAPHYYMTPKSLDIFYNNQSYFPHPIDNCLYFCKQFRQNHPFPQTRQVFTMLSRSKYNEKQLQGLLKNKICAVLNSGGGCIFITVEENGLVNGVDWMCGQQQEWKKCIENFRDFIFPTNFRIDVKEITIKHYQQQYEKKKAMIRVTLTPESTNFVYFVKKTVQKNSPIFYYFFLDPRNQSKSQDLLTVDNHGQIYKIIHNKNRKSNSFWSNQANGYPIKYSNSIKQCCLPPLPQNDQLKICQKKSDCREQVLTPIINLKKVEQVLIKTSYKHHSILILGNEASDAIIPEIERLFVASKLTLFKFYKPYTKYRDQSIKSIWFVTHQFIMENIQKILPKAEEQKPGCKVLAIITVTKYLYLEKIKPEQKLPDYFKQFKNIFNRGPIQLKLKTELPDHYNVYLKFDSFQESVFSFIYLDNCRLRTYFCKENVYLEKKAHMAS